MCISELPSPFHKFGLLVAPVRLELPAWNRSPAWNWSGIGPILLGIGRLGRLLLRPLLRIGRPTSAPLGSAPSASIGLRSIGQRSPAAYPAPSLPPPRRIPPELGAVSHHRRPGIGRGRPELVAGGLTSPPAAAGWPNSAAFHCSRAQLRAQFFER
jgi:hypothetical protein